MTCYHPIKGYRAPSGEITLNKRSGYADRPATVACRQCIGCRIDKSQQWAIRCYHEAQMHEDNCFITLTYAPEYLPLDMSVNIRDWQIFMKTVRNDIRPKKVRYFHCGEYGGLTGRPHYHAILFGLDFFDKEGHSETRGNKLYTSEKLSSYWPWGLATVGAATFQSSAYVARYIHKKPMGKIKDQLYEWTDPHTGEVHQRAQEYLSMSKKPGLGKTWLDKYAKEVFPSDFVVVNGSKKKVPDYYNKQLEVSQLPIYRDIRMSRAQYRKKNPQDKTKERLAVREKVKIKQTNNLKREME